MPKYITLAQAVALAKVVQPLWLVDHDISKAVHSLCNASVKYYLSVNKAAAKDAELLAASRQALKAMEDFRDKVHDGRARSVDSYDKFTVAAKALRLALESRKLN